MGERELIAHLRKLCSAGRPDWLKVDVGDDAAVVALASGEELIVTVDQVVAGVHFSGQPGPDLIAHKAVARALSDLAAMAASPLCTLAAALFPEGCDEAFCTALCDALWREAAELGAPLVGGDIASGGERLAITVTALGRPAPAGVVTRSGAEPGDHICVTGALGGAILERHLTFQPRIGEALELAERARVHAMIDISDGLSTDLLHIAEESHAGVAIEAAKIPVSQDAARLAEQDGREALWHALNDGEDYELLFCVSASDAEQLARSGLAGGLNVTVIGEVTDGPESRIIMPDGSRRPLRPEGWQHLQ